MMKAPEVFLVINVVFNIIKCPPKVRGVLGIIPISPGLIPTE